ncbi:L,D-transpeptidase family protein [Altererythrobacter confluentis]|uniref:L,D-transpeptidase family protein n=1 Tax=Allopontixanthobacter confluentis TaxID=1849021 RepID=A0A6L7GEL3_9SPHN|nr:L,D-transpeptidase family protein [Allopontixanthobacter confluentis]MXP13935.1 L,D-transpeptidase family protein [Allopontixanthobacter confluentis]
MRHILISASFLALAACGFNGTDGADGDAQKTSNAAPAQDNLADTMASNDAAEGQSAQIDIADSEERPIMQAQVVMDRRGFGPGVVDGKMGMSTENALRGFQEANGLEVTGKLDDATKSNLAQWDNIPATRVVTIPADWASLTFTKVPDGAAEQAKMEELGYNSLDEKLAERFHTTVDVLKMLNPDGKPAGMTASNDPGAGAAATNTAAAPSPAATKVASKTDKSGGKMTQKGAEKAFFRAGQMIRVPNIGADRIAPDAANKEGWEKTLASLGVGSDQPSAKKIVVSKSDGTLKAYGADNKLLALFTVTSGSKNDPLPLGDWGITGIAYNPPFAYNPELFWDVSDDEEKQQLPPGPNGPVGVVWIDLTKEHYGIHGTPEPQTIGRAESHGCVRLTNWDVARLAGMVSQDTLVLFEA